MACDAESDRIVLFGGYHGGSTAETWVFDADPTSWQRMNPSVAPSPRDGFGLAYDARADRIVLFGGIRYPNYDNDETWTYNLNANEWTNMHPVVSPPARLGGLLEYNARLDQVVLFGGHNAAGTGLSDTWAYNLTANSWTRMAPATSPAPYPFSATAYDAESDRVVLFGGQLDVGVANDTWAYDLANDTWTEMAPSHAPTPRAWDAAVYDPRADRVLLFGGDSAGENETWTYNLNANAWSELHPASAPPDRSGFAMAYDARSGRTILFGGMWPAGSVGNPALTKNRETWSFDRTNNTWTMVLGPLPPVPSFTFSPSSPVAGERVTFNASASSDVDGSIVEFSWSFSDGGALAGESVNRTFTTPDTYAITLTVRDDDGLLNSTARPVVVQSLPGRQGIDLLPVAGVLVAIVVVAVAIVVWRRHRRPAP